MVKVLKNFGTYAKWENGNSYVLTNEDLEIVFDFRVPKNYELYAHVKNEQKEYWLKFDDLNKIKIPYKELSIGVFDINVEFVKKGEVCKTVCAEGLKLFRINKEIEIIPQITELEKRVERAEKALKQIYTFIKEKGVIV